MRSLPSLNALRAFDLVARSGTITEAARRLHVTRPAISKQIKVLEDQMDCQLLIRTRPRVELTDEGDRLAAGLRQGFDQITATTQHVVEHSRRPETVRILIDRDFASSWLAERIGGFLIEHPGISVEVSAERNGRLRMEEDFSFRIFYGPEGHFKSEDLDEDFLCDWIDFPVCTPDYAARHIADEHLSETTHFLFDKNYDPWQAWCENSGVKHPGAGKHDSTSFDETALCLSAALAGTGITIGDSFMCLEDVVEERLVAPFKLGLRSVERYAICYSGERNLSKAEIAFRGWLVRAIADYEERISEVIAKIGIKVIDRQEMA